MLGLVAERPGHAAAAGVQVDHLPPGIERSIVSIGPTPISDRWWQSMPGSAGGRD